MNTSEHMTLNTGSSVSTQAGITSTLADLILTHLEADLGMTLTDIIALKDFGLENRSTIVRIAYATISTFPTRRKVLIQLSSPRSDLIKELNNMLDQPLKSS